MFGNGGLQSRNGEFCYTISTSFEKPGSRNLRIRQLKNSTNFCMLSRALRIWISYLIYPKIFSLKSQIPKLNYLVTYIICD